MKKIEIERRFLLFSCSVKRLLKGLGVAYEAVRIRQFYLVAEKDRVERYRQEGDRFLVTRKRGTGMVREEEEEVLSPLRFKEAMARNRGGMIVKTRYRFRYEGASYELDSFRKALKGLNILEIEFETYMQADRFVLPESLRKTVVAEVTERREFSNGALSRTMRIPAIATDLKRLLSEVEKRENFLKASTRVPLGAFESAEHAVKAVLYSLLLTLRANRDAMLSGDEDPERLHQFRVAMRKQRALLSQMDAVFSREWAARHKERLAALMRRTGEKRDIDVYLMEIPHYRGMLPSRYHEGLERLESYLRERLEEKGRELKAFLQGEALEEERQELIRFCREEGTEGLSQKAGEPLHPLLRKVLKKRYRRILHRGVKVDADSPASEYHRIRIDVKKLRYMMEFFSAIYDPEAYRKMLKDLKTIQTILGEHQDLDVQRRHLGEFARMDEIDDVTKEAIRALRAVMAKKEEQKRKAFREAFAEFRETEELLKRMICHF